MRYVTGTLAALALLAAVAGTARAQDGDSLDFDPTGREYQQLMVRAGQVIEFTKFNVNGDPVAIGTAGILNLDTLDTGTVPVGSETCRTTVLDADHDQLYSLVFIERSTADIYDVFAQAVAIDPDETMCQ